MNKNAKSTTNTPSLCLPPGAVDGGHIPPFYKGPNTNAVPKYPNVDSDHVHNNFHTCHDIDDRSRNPNHTKANQP
jgi:hypothetical protein